MLVSVHVLTSSIIGTIRPLSAQRGRVTTYSTIICMMTQSASRATRYIEGGRNNGYYTHDAEFSDLESDTYIVNDSHHRQLVG